MNLTLVVERSAPVGSWALYRDKTQVVSRCFGTARLRAPEWAAELLAGLAEQGVAPAALQQLVVGTGPGSFSGIRAAIALLQGVALPRNLPVYGLASAAVLARAMALQSRWETVAVVGDARRQHLWCAVYRCGVDGRLVLASTGAPPRHTSEDFALTTWEKLGAVVPAEAIVISPEWERLADGFRGTCIGSACHAAPLIPSAGDLGALFFSDGACARRDPVPVYLHPAVV